MLLCWELLRSHTPMPFSKVKFAVVAPESSLCLTRISGFDWTSLPAGSTVVDVGGGIGTQMLILARHFKHLKLIVEDREAVCSDTMKVRDT